MFNLIGLGEHAGSGVPDIYHAWKEVGLAEPEVEERFGNPDRTVLTLPLTSSDNTTDITTNTTTSGDVEDKLQAIISFCDEPRSRGEIQERLGIKSDRYIMLPSICHICRRRKS